jgi:phosphoribosylanthranilate isomerase
MNQLKLKICGLTIASQAEAVARLGVDAIGVIAVANTPRFLAAEHRSQLWRAVAAANPQTNRVLVVVNPKDSNLDDLYPEAGHQFLQLHGDETPERCLELQQRLDLPIWKAVRLRAKEDLVKLQAYGDVAEKLLLEPWVPNQLGGSGHTMPLEWLADFQPPCPWWIAGGIGPTNVAEAIASLQNMKLTPYGIDTSSAIEISPGIKNMELVKVMHKKLKGINLTLIPAV